MDDADLPIDAPKANPDPDTLPEIIPKTPTVDDLLAYANAGFVTSDDGSPILGVNGQPKKKPGRKPGGKNAPSGAYTGTETPTAAAPTAKTPATRKAQRVASEELARAVLSTSVGAMVALVGPEWDFQSQAEADGMKAATAAYIEAKGDGQLTPEAMLLLVVAGYALPRAAHENTRTKFGAFFSGLLNGLRRIFSR